MALPAVLGLLAAALIGALITLRRSLTVANALLEPSLFAGREFTTSVIALFLFFIAFAVWLLITVLFLQDLWHYSALKAGLAIAPGPMVAAGFALNSGRISGRFGRTASAVAGAVLIAVSAIYWEIAAPATPSYLIGFLPGLILGGAGAGLAQAPLFAAAGTLAPERTTTGSAVLNMARQVGSAVGVALLVALLGTSADALYLFQRGWAVEIGAAIAAGLSLLIPRVLYPRLTRRPSKSGSLRQAMRTS